MFRRKRPRPAPLRPRTSYERAIEQASLEHLVRIVPPGRDATEESCPQLAIMLAYSYPTLRAQVS